MKKLEIGKGRKIKDGEKVAILTIGHPGNFAVEACNILEAEGLNPAHYDLRFVKPLDSELLTEVFERFDKIITVEDGCLQGGFGTAIAEWMLDHDYSSHIKRLGIPDAVIEHGEQTELWHEIGIDAEGIVKAVLEFVEADLVGV